mmetsp:Transcript_28632/g.41634  ORF Transcript_28632/g.41634 Transcript_28632/m.41634 type:complete len:106 (+) Transcript_28632:157-474(+)
MFVPYICNHFFLNHASLFVSIKRNNKQDIACQTHELNINLACRHSPFLLGERERKTLLCVYACSLSSTNDGFAAFVSSTKTHTHHFSFLVLSISTHQPNIQILNY